MQGHALVASLAYRHEVSALQLLTQSTLTVADSSAVQSFKVTAAPSRVSTGERTKCPRLTRYDTEGMNTITGGLDRRRFCTLTTAADRLQFGSASMKLQT
jgi:hypothetical protein